MKHIVSLLGKIIIIIIIGIGRIGKVNFLVYGAQKIMAFRFISFHSIMGHPPHLITTLMESTIEATKSQTYSSYALASFSWVSGFS